MVLFRNVRNGNIMMEDFNWVQVWLAVAIHVVILSISAWDLLALATHHGELTVSSLVQSWARGNPMLAVVVGCLIGHLFWPIR